jgi:hypothetical protein
MAGGLYKSIFDKNGIYNTLYSREGGQQPYKSTDIRLGAADDDDDDDEDETPAPAKESFFAQEIAGFPTWVLGIFLLGFAWSYRRRKKEEKQV